MDHTNQHNKSNKNSKNIIVAPNHFRDNFSSGGSALLGFMPNQINELMMSSDSIREAMIQRKLEKERIREEIMLDIMRRRELEAEVRRELAMEEMALRRGDSLPINRPLSLPAWCVDKPNGVGYGIPELYSDPRLSMLNRPIGVGYGNTERHPEPRLANLDPPGGVSLTGRLSEPRLASQDKTMGVSLTDPLPSTTQAESDTQFPFQRNPDAAKVLEMKKAQLKNVAKPFSALVGKKRKLGSNVANDSSGSSSKKNPQDWKCTVCNVSSTSQKNHEIHLQGKKHQLKAQLGEVYKNTRKARKRETEAGRKLRIEELKKRFRFCCVDCGVGCHSEIVLMRHCSGIKHIARMAELKLASGTGSSTGDKKDEVETEGPEGSETAEHMVDNSGEAAEVCTQDGTESTGEVGMPR